MIKPLLCKATGHKVNRNRVWHDGQNFRTKCQKCQTPLIREFGDWKPFDFKKHGADQRRPHPNTGKAA